MHYNISGTRGDVRLHDVGPGLGNNKLLQVLPYPEGYAKLTFVVLA